MQTLINLVLIHHSLQVYLPAIADLVPSEMVRAISSFLEFYYLARQDRQTHKTLEAMKCALARFHQYSQIFIDEGVRKDLNLPRQHAL